MPSRVQPRFLIGRARIRVFRDVVSDHVGALLLEQNEKWQLQRRYMSLEPLRALVDNQTARLAAVVN